MCSSEQLLDYKERCFIAPAAFPRDSSTVRAADIRLDLVVTEYSINTTIESACTLIFTHGTSFNRTFWEPIVHELLKIKNRGLAIKRIITMDAANHGDSYIVNKAKLTDKTYWPDHSRDVIAVLKYLKVSQPVIGIGHSFGGGVLCHAALMAPELFKATIFVEPILFQMKGQTDTIAQRALRRKDHWQDLSAVRKAFSSSKEMSSWSSDQRERYISNCTVEISSITQQRCLKTPKEQEAATYRAAPFKSITKLLEKSLEIHFFVLGAQSLVLNGEKREWLQKVTRKPGKVIILEDAGHLIPMTHPLQLGQIVADLIAGLVHEEKNTLLESKL